MLLQMLNAGKTFKNGDIAFDAVREINFQIDRGEYICVTGRSGSGKSTFLNLLTGLIKPTSGNVFYQGMDIWGQDDHFLSKMRNSQISYMMQGYSLLNNLTLKENILLPAVIYRGSKEAQEKAENLIHKVGLEGKEHNYPKELSGGEARRGMIARALINDPSVFISDEPTDGLDEMTADLIMDLFDEIYREGTALLVVSHEQRFKEQAKDVYKMERGCLKYESEAENRINVRR